MRASEAIQITRTFGPSSQTNMSPAILGTFEHQVLLAVVRLGGSAYSAEVVVELEQCTGREISPAAVYIALRRLADREMLSSVKIEPKPGEGGRGRRTFDVQPAALEELRQTRRLYERLWEGLDAAFEQR